MKHGHHGMATRAPGENARAWAPGRGPGDDLPERYIQGKHPVGTPMHLAKILALMALGAAALGVASWHLDNRMYAASAALLASGVALMALGRLLRPKAACTTCGTPEPSPFSFCHRCGS
jgi:hypothetical protein